MPIGQGEHFKGVVDLLTMKEVRFDGEFGEKVVYTELKEGNPLFKEATKQR